MKFKNAKEAMDYVGGFSSPSKMPCYSFSIPAQECKTGSKLRKVCGSVCEKCYAQKGRYLFSNVKNALARRFLRLNIEGWTDAFVFAITEKKMSHFRFFDSGDVQSVSMLRKIAEIAERCPSCKFWLPTKEVAIVNQYLAAGNVFPENLNVRVSAYMVDGLAPIAFAKNRGLTVSCVSSDKSKTNCSAYKNGGECGECRACWNKNVFEIVYPKH